MYFPNQNSGTFLSTGLLVSIRAALEPYVQTLLLPCTSESMPHPIARAVPHMIGPDALQSAAKPRFAGSFMQFCAYQTHTLQSEYSAKNNSPGEQLPQHW